MGKPGHQPLTIRRHAPCIDLWQVGGGFGGIRASVFGGFLGGFLGGVRPGFRRGFGGRFSGSLWGGFSGSFGLGQRCFRGGGDCGRFRNHGIRGV
ncbi:hypothetical protein EI545_18000 [Tabrizicola piscis]|uniref:Uncharacterized protein n=1 Tax=Tabrizicola piscis TaxID=2494374 RepID=A0A3S8UAF3_9RHOB|nr:hypothetical protein EI545_18000 [Tabrizicola piscis]